MITIVLGLVGSGKSASTIHAIVNNPQEVVYTNMDTFTNRTKHVMKIKPEHIFKKTLVSVKKNGEEVHKLEFNKEYWQDVMQTYDKISVVIDEAHTFFNPRRSMSKINIIMGDFLSMLRRIVGGVGSAKGNLILITQLGRRMDIIAREMATHVIYCVNIMEKRCPKCAYSEQQSNEQPEQNDYCPHCQRQMKLQKQYIVQFHFQNMEKYERWHMFGDKTYYKKIVINDIESIFSCYNTIQWEDFFSDF